MTQFVDNLEQRLSLSARQKSIREWYPVTRRRSTLLSVWKIL